MRVNDADPLFSMVPDYRSGVVVCNANYVAPRKTNARRWAGAAQSRDGGENGGDNNGERFYKIVHGFSSFLFTGLAPVGHV